MNFYLKGDESGLVGYWRMNEGNGITIADRTFNGNNASIENVLWVEGTPYLKEPSRSLLLLLDGAGIKSDDSFIKRLTPFVKKIQTKEKKKLSTFDLTRAIVAHNTSSAVKILNTLLHNREKPQMILGGIIWQWENMKDKISLDKFRQGLNILLNTDVKIKTGKLKEGLALEMLVIRLSYLA